MVQSVNKHSFVGAGSLMSIRYHSDQQFPQNSIIHIGLRHVNPPILENKHYLPIKLLSKLRRENMAQLPLSNYG